MSGCIALESDPPGAAGRSVRTNPNRNATTPSTTSNAMMMFRIRAVYINLYLPGSGTVPSANVSL
jgi:hypothetical protein